MRYFNLGILFVSIMVLALALRFAIIGDQAILYVITAISGFGVGYSFGKLKK